MKLLIAACMGSARWARRGSFPNEADKNPFRTLFVRFRVCLALAHSFHGPTYYKRIDRARRSNLTYMYVHRSAVAQLHRSITPQHPLSGNAVNMLYRSASRFLRRTRLARRIRIFRQSFSSRRDSIAAADPLPSSTYRCLYVPRVLQIRANGRNSTCNSGYSTPADATASNRSI